MTLLNNLLKLTKCLATVAAAHSDSIEFICTTQKTFMYECMYINVGPIPVEISASENTLADIITGLSCSVDSRLDTTSVTDRQTDRQTDTEIDEQRNRRSVITYKLTALAYRRAVKIHLYAGPEQFLAHPLTTNEQCCTEVPSIECN